VPGLSGPLARLKVHSSDQAGEEPQVTLNKEPHSNGFGFEFHFATKNGQDGSKSGTGQH